MWFFGLIFLINLVTSYYFECPSTPITVDDGPIGVIPRGRVGLSVIPANYSCHYSFIIPAGYALHFSISTYYEFSDLIQFTDNLGVDHILPLINQHIDQWAGAPRASLDIQTVSNGSQMFAIYEFVNVDKKYKQIKLPTGEYFSLADMKSSYYTFQSSSNDRVALNIAVKSTQDYDPLLDQIFVYDGGDIKCAKMVARLSTFLKKQKVSTYSNITILNVFNAPSPSYLIGNDYSKISKYGKYKAILTSKNQQVTGELYDASDMGSAYTWICSDCQHFYWNVLKFHTSKTNKDRAYIDIRPLSPSHDMPTLLNYSLSPFISSYFPQLIPTRMFTMINHYSGIAVTLDTSYSSKYSSPWYTVDGCLGNTKDRWLLPYDGRKGTIFSPSAWDPKTSPAFEFNFEDDSKKFMFGVNVKAVQIANSGEALTIKTGPASSENSSYQEFFSQRTEFWTRREAKGNFMQISYDGKDSRSLVVVGFDMKTVNFSISQFYNFYIFIFIVYKMFI